MAWVDYNNYDNNEDEGGGGYYPYDQAWSDVNGGWQYVPSDPSLTQGYGYNPGYNPYFDPTFGGKDPMAYGSTAAQDSAGFVDPNGNWVDNPGYDPTLSDLPMGSAGSNPNLSPGYMGQDPLGGSGSPSDPYQFSTDATGQMPTDPTLPNPPSAPSYQPDPFPSGIGNGIPSEPPAPAYPSPGPMTQGAPVRGTPAPTPQPSPTPAPGKPSTPPAAKASTSTPTSNASFSIGGMPPISTNLPGEQKFTYQPVSIARQGAPNPTPPPFQQQNPQQADPYGVMSVGNPLNPYNRLAQDQARQKQFNQGI